MYELIPHIEKKFRGIGEGWARFMYGGSTGGWEAMGAQVFYPDFYNGAGSPAPTRSTSGRTRCRHLRGRERVLLEGPSSARRARAPQLPGAREHDARGDEPPRAGARHEGPVGRAVGHLGGGLLAGGADGYPKPIWDKRTGVIDREVAEHWREHYDLGTSCGATGRRSAGQKLQGKLHIYVGDMDNYYLNNAVYLVEEFLKDARRTRPTAGVVDYGDARRALLERRPQRPNAISRLRYAQMFAPKIVLTVPKKNLDAYRNISRAAGKVWREHGALEYRECAGDDLKVKFGLPFPRLAKARPGEVVVFSWILYKSRADRNRVNAKVMKDPRITKSMTQKMPFDVKRMAYGGFKVFVDV
jgi:uncharacterized protein YbaA (DUF1428 family)